MSAPLLRRAIRLLTGCAAVAVLAGCGSFNDTTRNFAASLTPYRVEVIQGNFVSREQVEALQKGMVREQVRGVLGTPLVTSVFHADRWDYVFTLKRQGSEPQARRLSVFFQGDVLDRFEGDEMPSEAEFVAQLESRRKFGKAPQLEATEDALKRFPAPKKVADEAAAAAPAPSGATSYPPLEAPAR